MSALLRLQSFEDLTKIFLFIDAPYVVVGHRHVCKHHLLSVELRLVLYQIVVDFVPQSMDLSVLIHLAIATAIVGTVGCVLVSEAKTNHNENPLIKCIEALDYLHETLPIQTPLEDRCKRYAVVTSFMTAKGRPQHQAKSSLGKLSVGEINRFYRKLEAKGELPLLYMTAIDGYRASKLGPPFLELIECLKRIDRPCVDTYLNNPELLLIVDLHKQVLRRPETKFDLANIESADFSPAFLRSLECLFRNNLHDSSAGWKRSTDLYRNDQQAKKGFPWGQCDPEEMSTRHHHRELERLRNHRTKLLDPSVVERTRERQRQRRLRQGRKDRHCRCRTHRKGPRLGSLQQIYDRYQPYATQSESPVSPSLPFAQRRNMRRPTDRDSAEQQWAYPGTEVAPVAGATSSTVLPDSQSSEIEPRTNLRTQHELNQNSQDLAAQHTLRSTRPLLSSSERAPILESPPMSEIDQAELTPRAPCNLAFEYNCQAYDHLTDLSHYDTYALPTLDQFDDTDSVLQSFLDMSGESKQNKFVDTRDSDPYSLSNGGYE